MQTLRVTTCFCSMFIPLPFPLLFLAINPLPGHYCLPPPPPPPFIETLSEAVKLLKVHYLLKAIDAHKMDQAIIFCRTKLDCDNVESYLLYKGGGKGRVCLVGICLGREGGYGSLNRRDVCPPPPMSIFIPQKFFYLSPNP